MTTNGRLRVLILGAGSGIAQATARLYAGESAIIGLAGRNIGRLAGIEMWGTASSGKHDLVRSIGGTPIDYKSEDFVAVVRRATGDGVDLVLDPVGWTYFRRSFGALRPGGKLIGYGISAAVTHRAGLLIGLGSFALLGLLPLTSRSRSAEWFNITTLKKKHKDWFREDLGKLMQMLADKKIHPLVAERLPLRDATRAHQLLESAAVVGKIVLLPQA